MVLFRENYQPFLLVGINQSRLEIGLWYTLRPLNNAHLLGQLVQHTRTLDGDGSRMFCFSYVLRPLSMVGPCSDIQDPHHHFGIRWYTGHVWAVQQPSCLW